ncbi:MAG: hypothetical protein HPY72_12915 [Anaerolineae bacterium]|nr:hypothetical protein [Anaerolineae bacterium]
MQNEIAMPAFSSSKGCSRLTPCAALRAGAYGAAGSRNQVRDQTKLSFQAFLFQVPKEMPILVFAACIR